MLMKKRVGTVKPEALFVKPSIIVTISSTRKLMILQLMTLFLPKKSIRYPLIRRLMIIMAEIIAKSFFELRFTGWHSKS